jgi:hypothetical protein
MYKLRENYWTVMPAPSNNLGTILPRLTQQTNLFLPKYKFTPRNPQSLSAKVVCRALRSVIPGQTCVRTLWSGRHNLRHGPEHMFVFAESSSVPSFDLRMVMPHNAQSEGVCFAS